MPRRIEHHPNAQYEQILAEVAGQGKRLRIPFASAHEATKFRNSYYTWRSLVLREHRAGRLALPFGFDDVVLQTEGEACRFVMRETTRQFVALGRLEEEPTTAVPAVPATAVAASEPGPVGGTERSGLVKEDAAK